MSAYGEFLYKMGLSKLNSLSLDIYIYFGGIRFLFGLFQDTSLISCNRFHHMEYNLKPVLWNVPSCGGRVLDLAKSTT